MRRKIETVVKPGQKIKQWDAHLMNYSFKTCAKIKSFKTFRAILIQLGVGCLYYKYQSAV